MSAPATRTVTRGRGHQHFLDGERVPGVTTITGDGVPKPALIDWVGRATAGYAIDHWHELAKLPVSVRLRRLEKARFEETRAAGARGTKVHELAARYVIGDEIVIPDELRGHVEACIAFLEEWRPRELLIETTVVNRRWRYMGRLDLVAIMGQPERCYVLDWKTAASGVWSETALQLAAYAHCETYLDANGDEQPMPHIEAGAAVWLRADGYDVIPVDISDETFRMFLYAQQIAAFAGAPRETYVGAALQAPALEAAS